MPLQNGDVQIRFIHAERCCSCVPGPSVMLPQPAVVQLQASGVLPASQPVIAVTGGAPALQNHAVNALSPAAGNGSSSGKIPVTKPLLQSSTPAMGLDVSSDSVTAANRGLCTSPSYLHQGSYGPFRVSGKLLIGFLTVNRELSSLAQNRVKQPNICWLAWSCRPGV